MDYSKRYRIELLRLLDLAATNCALTKGEIIQKCLPGSEEHIVRSTWSKMTSDSQQRPVSPRVHKQIESVFSSLLGYAAVETLSELFETYNLERQATDKRRSLKQLSASEFIELQKHLFGVQLTNKFDAAGFGELIRKSISPDALGSEHQSKERVLAWLSLASNMFSGTDLLDTEVTHLSKYLAFEAARFAVVNQDKDVIRAVDILVDAFKPEYETTQWLMQRCNRIVFASALLTGEINYDGSPLPKDDMRFLADLPSEIEDNHLISSGFELFGLPIPIERYIKNALHIQIEVGDFDRADLIARTRTQNPHLTYFDKIYAELSVARIYRNSGEYFKAREIIEEQVITASSSTNGSLKGHIQSELANLHLAAASIDEVRPMRKARQSLKSAKEFFVQSENAIRARKCAEALLATEHKQ